MKQRSRSNTSHTQRKPYARINSHTSQLSTEGKSLLKELSTGVDKTSKQVNRGKSGTKNGKKRYDDLAQELDNELSTLFNYHDNRDQGGVEKMTTKKQLELGKTLKQQEYEQQQLAMEQTMDGLVSLLSGTTDSTTSTDSHRKDQDNEEEEEEL